MKLGSCAVLMFLLACLAGCTTSSDKAPVKEFHLRGEVLGLDAAQRIATIRHDKIEGWMEAMTMDFPVREGEDLEKIKPGARLEATVFVTGLTFTIGNIHSAAP